ncbi:hypothetical protein PACTADRAFT_48543 [Pachysolen tannophilus NRRL Y-2460]|uniref:LicD/FKTN/FKRP nucleotidyltransferase domain-containing protein n=1 Tax=Pachysolen tannophilus NRRL Y-2460 TaxID=669874 RepID=A0A1E4TYA0_PACTA|nr:hypothetical protein PACTADRAFT_48543 [Pachysolen tannophilus NRRL Y-2460]
MTIVNGGGGALTIRKLKILLSLTLLLLCISFLLFFAEKNDPGVFIIEHLVSSGNGQSVNIENIKYPEIIDEFEKLNITSSYNSLSLDDKIYYKLREINEIISNNNNNNNNNDDEYWKFNYKISNPELKINLKDLKEKFLDNKNFYDPRFTYSIYLNLIKQNSNNADFDYNKNLVVPFSWEDWVDLTILNQYITNKESKLDCNSFIGKYKEKKGFPKQFCINNNDMPAEFNKDKLPGFNIQKSTSKISSIETGILAGKSFLNSFAPIPRSILFLTNGGAYELDIGEKKSIMDSDLFNKYLSNNNIDELKVNEDTILKFNPSVEYAELLKTIPFKINNDEFNLHKALIKSDYSYELNPNLFNFSEQKVKTILEYYETKLTKDGSLPRNELDHYNSLKYSLNYSVGKLPKYFGEPKVRQDAANRMKGRSDDGGHYDWRFFNGILFDKTLGLSLAEVQDRKIIILHRLLRTWLQFTYQQNIITWIAHGTMLSWYFNGIQFPYDNDIDVQMPILELNKFSARFNNSLVVEDLTYGFGKYYVDCGAFMTHRSRENNNNNIDARFIDVDTGMYIDITALSLSNSKTPARYKNNKEVYNCRNNHFYSIQELSPVTLSLMEGALTLIPENFSQILTEEYPKGLINKDYREYFYIDELKLWIPYRNLLDFFKNLPNRSEEEKKLVSKPKLKNFVYKDKKLTPDLILKFLESDKSILKQVFSSFYLSDLHNLEMTYLKNDDYKDKNAKTQFVNLLEENYSIYKPLTKSLFDFDLELKKRGSKNVI